MYRSHVSCKQANGLSGRLCYKNISPDVQDDSTEVRGSLDPRTGSVNKETSLRNRFTYNTPTYAPGLHLSFFFFGNFATENYC